MCWRTASNIFSCSLSNIGDAIVTANIETASSIYIVICIDLAINLRLAPCNEEMVIMSDLHKRGIVFACLMFICCMYLFAKAWVFAAINLM